MAVASGYRATNNPNSRGLSKRQLSFVELYNGNSTETAVNAGYGSKSAKMAGLRNMQNVTVRKLIEQRQAKEIKPLVMDRIARQEFWTKVIKDEELPIRERLRASELLGKSEGDFLERVDMTGETTTQIRITRLNIAWQGERGIEEVEHEIEE